VSVDPTGIAAGTTCNGTISMVTSSGTQALDVTMVVSTTAGNNVTLSATPTTLSFNYLVGGPNPAAQLVAISGAGTASTFSLATSSSGWLKISATCTTAAPCTTPNAGTFSLPTTVDPAGLNVGTYYGTIVIAGTSQATGTSNVNVSLTVTAPPPVITLVTNAASFVTGPVSPARWSRSLPTLQIPSARRPL